MSLEMSSLFRSSHSTMTFSSKQLTEDIHLKATVYKAAKNCKEMSRRFQALYLKVH